MPDPRASATDTILSHLMLLFLCLLVMWGVEAVDFVFFAGGLDQFGVRPRELAGLWGIVFSPFLHGDFRHLATNTVPFAILGWCVMLRRVSDFVAVTGFSALLGGLGVWLLGAPRTVHIGVSGVVFGYLGFLLGRALFERSIISVALALVASFLYGGLVWGLVQFEEGVSWEGHLCGFGAGLLAARLLKRRSTRRARVEWTGTQ
ncbi:MAG: rhomboid family intramembrane serine protease [Planctomycetota bacterium]